MNIKEEIEKLASEQEAIGKRAAAIKGELETANEETTLKLKAELETLDARSKEIPGEKARRRGRSALQANPRARTA